MKDTKRTIVLLQPFDYEGIEAYLEKKAREGWQLDSIGSLMWKFRRAESADSHYSVVFIPKTSAYDPQENETLKEFEEYCNESGWHRVDSSGKMHIFRSDEDDPTPIETDERIKLNNVKNSMITSYLMQLAIISILLFMMDGGIFAIWVTPIYTLSSYTGMFATLMSTVTIILFIVCLGQFIKWYKGSKRSIDEGGYCISIAPHRKLYYTVMALIVAVWFVWIIAQVVENGKSVAFVAIVYIVVIFVLVAIGWRIKEFFRKKEMSRAMNRFVSTVIIIVMALALTGGFGVAVLIIDEEYNGLGYFGHDKEKMPLVAEDLRDTGDYVYTYDWESTRTFIMGHDEGWQESEVTTDELGSGDLTTCDINYEIVYVGEGKLYQSCLRELMSENLFWFSGLGSHDPAEKKWRETDNPTRAKMIYRSIWNDEFTDDWILCYPDRIVKVVPYFDDELNDKDLKIIDDKLGTGGTTDYHSGYIEAGDNI